MKPKRNFLILLLIVAASLVNVYAFDFSPGTVPNRDNPSWRLQEQLSETYSDSSWNLQKLAQYYYNALAPSLPDSVLTSYYDAYLGWVPAATDCFTYQQGSDYVTEILTRLHFMGTSYPFMRSCFQYDAQNRLTEAVVQILGRERNWIDCRRLHAIYYADFLMQIVCWDEGDANTPAGYSSMDFGFDMQGRISDIYENSSQDSTDWQQSYHTILTYHPNDTTTGTSLIEEFSRRFPYAYSYDQPWDWGMLAEKNRQLWMYAYWQNDFRDFYVYDTSNRLTGHTVFSWTMVGDWQNQFLNTLSYDDEGNLAQDLFQTWEETYSAWVDSKRDTYIWEPLTENDDNAIPPAATLAVKAYPNPFRTSLEIMVTGKPNTPTTIEIYNCKGQKLYRSDVQADNGTINSEALASAMDTAGIYFLKVSKGRETAYSKVIKIK